MDNQRATKTADVIEIKHHGAALYGGSRPEAFEPAFELEIDDRRRESGYVDLVMAACGGSIDDQLHVRIEANDLPDAGGPTQCVHVHFENGELALSIFKVGAGLVIRLDTDAKTHSLVLPDGERLIAVE